MISSVRGAKREKMRFKQRKELADKYREWVKQPIDNNQTMILDCAESVIAFLDINGYLKEVVRGEWELVDEAEPRRYACSVCKCLSWDMWGNYCPNCGARMVKE